MLGAEGFYSSTDERGEVLVLRGIPLLIGVTQFFSVIRPDHFRCRLGGHRHRLPERFPPCQPDLACAPVGTRGIMGPTFPLFHVQS